MRIDTVINENGILPGNSGINEKKEVQLAEDNPGMTAAYTRSQVIAVNRGMTNWMEQEAGEEKKTRGEMLENIGSDAAQILNQMSVRDARAVMEDGFSLETEEVDTIVTVVDKIRIELAKSQPVTPIPGEAPSAEQLEKITGNPVLAGSIEEVFTHYDLPITEEITAEISQAWELSKELAPPSETGERYLIGKQIEPTIYNLYMAENATMAASPQVPLMEVPQELKDPIQQKLQQIGIEVKEETLRQAQWLVSNNLPLTKENMDYIGALKVITLPMNAKEFATAVAHAILEGKMPREAYVLPGLSLVGKAEEIADTINELPRELKDLTLKRQMEEIRLAMSVEANLSLLKKGITIDTSQLQDLVENLKEQEESYYKKLLTQGDEVPSMEKIHLFRETEDKVHQLNYMPAAVLDIRTVETHTLDTLYQKGTILAEQFQKAEMAYETVMTSPRKDMGDTIGKAFRNVADILTDIHLEPSPENQRAVRILAYNQQPLTADSIQRMKSVDQQVQYTLSRMTPKVVVSMIKEGYNPLHATIKELSKKIDAVVETADPRGEEKYSKFLWKLDQNQELSTEEREAYIGIYRLIHQVEKTDGAAIGAVLLSGGEVTMKNLLTQVRSQKASGMDIEVDETFGEVHEQVKNGLSITQQIEMVYQSNCLKETLDVISPKMMDHAMKKNQWDRMTPEQLLTQVKGQEAEYEPEYVKEQMKMLQEAQNAQAKVEEILHKFDLPKTTLNILAANQLLTNRNKALKDILENKKLEEEIDLKAVKEEILEDFAQALSAPTELAKVQEKLGDIAEHVMKTMLVSKKAASLDLRDLKIATAQIALGTAQSQKEEYEIPVLIGGELATVNLKIVRGTEEKGRVDLLFDTIAMGKVTAQFTITNHEVRGMVVSNKKETIDRLQKKETELREEGRDVSYVYSQYNKEGMPMKKSEGEAINEETVQTKRLYEVARKFLEMVKSA
ncbi:MAG: DUF6240 domain-containing protein [Lachnospiraceae bacterium]